ncbi:MULTISPECIES: UDP-N-acetylmuramoyl-tripeptide--D-alanyl-D-alanine ligase [Kordiimonas]|uniref:UDP-N-acetylmuramoyl-tripeptide--D-alanyl-D- alanine ligase n=1 Tax=Kordiimonas TaxID=288021 RepID=UPI00257D3985|nr:UDP-N-acetylmuramoyl-tripeptide--D-alanyl-D-alanine ligase [Kordiimonas sp. UBA4487]
MFIKEPLWTSAELGAMCGGLNARPWYADGVQTDSREVMPGDLFVALKGEFEDGHSYLADAFARGAVAALVSESVDGFDLGDTRLVHVADTLESLRLMAAEARRRAPAKIIAVTGSAGKTSVVHALRKSLERVDSTHASIKSYNNHVGVPLSLARMTRTSRFGIFELGMSGPGQIRHNTTLVRPHVAVVTGVGAAHTEAFSNVEAIAGAKAEIFEGLVDGGVAVINIDHPYAHTLVELAKKTGHEVVTVSVTGDADVRPLRMTEHHNCTCLTAEIAGTPITYKIGQAGREWVQNSLLVLAAVKAAGGDLGHAAMALAALEAEPGRGRTHTLKLPYAQATLLDDSYNANSLSMKAALRRLSLVPLSQFGRRIAVLADMRELGDEAKAVYQTLAKDIEKFGVSKIYSFGPEITNVAKRAGVDVVACNSVAEGVNQLVNDLRDGDAVMVKGANSAGLTKFVELLLEQNNQEIREDATRVAGVANAL